MPKENFILLNLKDDESKQLAQVITNDTSRKILDYLANVKDATESSLAEHLKIPISTIHYNLQALVRAKLVNVDEFHYSAKGKEVNHYSIANKYVIIAPKEAPETLYQKLRKILPVGIIGLAIAGAIQVYDYLIRRPASFLSTVVPQDKIRAMVTPAADMAEEEIVHKSAGGFFEIMKQTAVENADSVPRAFQAVPAENASGFLNVTNQCMANITCPPQLPCPQPASEPNIALWFLFGFILAIIVYFLLDLLIHRKNATSK